MAFDGGVDLELLLSAVINQAVKTIRAVAKGAHVKFENTRALIITLIKNMSHVFFSYYSVSITIPHHSNNIPNVRYAYSFQIYWRHWLHLDCVAYHRVVCHGTVDQNVSP